MGSHVSFQHVFNGGISSPFVVHGKAHTPGINQSYLVNEVILWRVCLSLPTTEGRYRYVAKEGILRRRQ